MADNNMFSRQQRLQQQIAMNARQQQMQMMAMQQQRQAMSHSSGIGNASSTSQPARQPMQPQSTTMGSTYDDLPIMEPNDFSFISQMQSGSSPSESICSHGPLSIVQSIISSKPRTPSFLHHGLTQALSAGNIEISQYLLSAGAPIVRATPNNILSAPPSQQIPLFELLTHHGWSPNTPGHYGAVLLPSIVTNLPLLRWFLAHGADPNLGAQRDNRDRTGGPDTDSCAALESAAGRGDVEAVQLLLDAGAVIQNGHPLHCAAGACPPGMHPHAGRVEPSKEFDESRIPVMELLMEHGADVNQREVSRHMVAGYAVVHAVMAGAVERVRWLLERRADPEATGAWGSAVQYARALGSEEMRRVLEEGVAARKWINTP